MSAPSGRDGSSLRNDEDQDARVVVVGVPEPLPPAGAHDSRTPQPLSSRPVPPPPTRTTRKRRRVLLAAFDASSGDLSRPGRDGDTTENKDDNDDTPDFGAFSRLLGALLLTAGLALLAALDAQQQCLRHETSALSDLLDDDAALRQEGDGDAYGGAADGGTSESESDGGGAAATAVCTRLLRHMATTAGLTALCGIIGLGLLQFYHRKWRRRRVVPLTSAFGYTPAKALRLTMTVLLLSAVVLVAQTYSILVVMLRPRRGDAATAVVIAEGNDDAAQQQGQAGDDAPANDGYTTDGYNNNPYQSLAAVDRFGHVGDNANLYYLSWITECLALALVYQLVTAAVRLLRAARAEDATLSSSASAPLLLLPPKDKSAASTTAAVATTLLPAAPWDDYHHYYDSDDYADTNRHRSSRRHRNRLRYLRDRAVWFQSLYRLRARAGIWVAALFACLVLLAAALATWNQVIWPYTRASPVDASSLSQPAQYLQICSRFATDGSSGSNSYATGNGSNDLPSVALCRRTVGAWLSGVIATALCATAIAMHLAARRSALTRHLSVLHLGLSPTWSTRGASSAAAVTSPSDAGATPSSATAAGPSTSWEQIMIQNKIPLRTELVLSCLLSALLGFNAVFATSVRGPAATVGNLYYASWISFLLCLRICLGCVEEYHNLEENGKETQHDINKDALDAKHIVAMGPQQYQPPSLATSVDESHTAVTRDTLKPDPPLSDPMEKNRVKRLRGYFFLSIFSVVCACSAYDAALNQQRKRPTTSQRYMMLVPVVVSVISASFFVLCLSKRCYQIIASFWIGGISSIVCFLFWFVDLLITMHSENSWAVNSVGEIKDANLYYFSWAAIITAGIQMMFYVKDFFGIHYTDNMILVWMSICKVCFVILGASLHIWHTIGSNCEFDEITYGAVTYCSRTILSIVVALTGLLVGGLVVFGRICVHLCPICRCNRLQAHVEMLISMFLVLLFGAAVALITGIGGPGQSPGDLYYASWIAFWVCLGIFITCYSQLQEEEGDETAEIEMNKRSLSCAKHGRDNLYTHTENWNGSLAVRNSVLV